MPLMNGISYGAETESIIRDEEDAGGREGRARAEGAGRDGGEEIESRGFKFVHAIA